MCYSNTGSCVQYLYFKQSPTHLLPGPLTVSWNAWKCQMSRVCHKCAHSFSSLALCLPFHFLCVVKLSLFFCYPFLLHCFCLSFFCLGFSSISTSIYSQFVSLCSHITKVMGWLVKNIFASATLFFCCDFSSTRRLVDVGRGKWWRGGHRHVCNSTGRKTEKRQMTSENGWFRLPLNDLGNVRVGLTTVQIGLVLSHSEMKWR